MSASVGARAGLSRYNATVTGVSTEMIRRLNSDPRQAPAYSVGEASHYLRLPAATVRWWSVGRDSYPSLISPAKGSPLSLSFLNLVELHIISAIRRDHKLPLPTVRSAIEYLAEKFDDDHPLLSRELQTDGLNLFIEHLGQLVNISRQGQTAMRAMLDAALKRIDRDPSGIPIKLYPFTRTSFTDAPAIVVIDPTISAGRPVLRGSGVATEIIAERYKAGDSISDLAEDYGRTREEIEEAIRCELPRAA